MDIPLSVPLFCAAFSLGALLTHFAHERKVSTVFIVAIFVAFSVVSLALNEQSYEGQIRASVYNRLYNDLSQGYYCYAKNSTRDYFCSVCVNPAIGGLGVQEMFK